MINSIGGKSNTATYFSNKLVGRALFVILISMISTTNAYSQVWFPWETRVCAGETYTQRTASGQTRQRVGTKPEYCRCTAGFVPKRETICAGTTFTANCANAAWSHYNRPDFGSSLGSSWSPNTSTVFVGTQFTQTSNCGVTRRANGTKPLPDADADGVADAADTCPATSSGHSVNAQGCSTLQLNGVANDETQAALAAIFATNYIASSRISPKGVCVYTEPNLRGRRQCFTSSTAKLNDTLINNVLSIRVSPEYQATIYQFENFGGRFVNYAASSETIEGLYAFEGFNSYIESVAVATVDAPTSGGQVNPNDYDLDGVNDADDLCPSSAPEDVVGIAGCVATTADTDNDGVTDDLDYCSGTSTSHTADAQGCADEQKDADNDGIIDSQDPYPLQHSTQCTV